ncbi:MAG: hypothetical protein JHC33_05305 [Ignisphaera sp.]|jgi:hypothetical protein|nr:hypothetical protein [Ignisphaera sp.]
MTQEQIKEFQKFLYDRDALEEWIRLAHFDSNIFIYGIINSSFEWDKSKQGFKFWSNVNEDWESYANFSEKEVGITSDEIKKIMDSSKARKVLKALIQ